MTMKSLRMLSSIHVHTLTARRPVSASLRPLVIICDDTFFPANQVGFCHRGVLARTTIDIQHNKPRSGTFEQVFS